MSSAPTSAQAQAGHLIAFIGGKGGVGKSVVSANFAMALAMDSKISVALVDADPAGSGDQTLVLGVKKINGFGDKVIDGSVKDANALRALMTPVPAGKSGTGVHFIQLFANPERLGSENPEAVEMAVKMIKRSFGVTIVDCGSVVDDSVCSILDQATLIIVVTNPEILVLNQTKKVIEKLQGQLYPSEITKVVINRFTNGSPYNPPFIEKTLNRQVVAVIPDDATNASLALARGIPFVVGAPQGEATKALLGMGRLLIERKILEQLAKITRRSRPKAAVTSSSSAAETGGAEVASGGARGMNNDTKDPRSAFKLRVHAQLVEKMDLRKEDLNRNLTAAKKDELRRKATVIVSEIVNREDHPWKSREEIKQLTKEVLDEALGLGPLEEFLADPQVTEIMVNRADLIYLEKNGRAMKSKVTFSSNAQLMQVIERIVTPIGRRIDEKTPYCDARLADGSRVHAIIPPLSIDGPMLTIRKFPAKRLGPQDLVNFKSVTPEMADFLRACIEARLNVLISGGTGSGKTTLLNILSSFIPANERILTVEDAAELQLQQEHVGRLETRPPNIEGTGAVTIRDLVRQTLRMRPDRIIIGEVRAGEALDMLQAMNTGHDGSMATVHSNSPREAIARLETLVMMAGMDLPVKAIREQMAGAVNLIVQQSRLQDGSRKVTHITEVVGMQGEIVTLQDIFVFRQDGLDNDRKVIGKHVATGFIPKFLEKIKSLGINVPRDLFKAA
jgi:pilus assembly protein CpaF